MGIEKREKDIEEAFAVWEQKQFRKKIEREERTPVPRKGDCLIY